VMFIAGEGGVCDSGGMKRFALAASALSLSGCIVGTVARTAVDVATIPVKVVSAGVDAATTSQSEADEKRGRELRKADEKRAREEREAAKRAAEQPQTE
jgi:hypothetical protein